MGKLAIQLTTPLLLRKPCKLFASVARVCQRQLGFLVYSHYTLHTLIYRDCYHYLFSVLCSAAFHLLVVCAFVIFFNKCLVSCTLYERAFNISGRHLLYMNDFAQFLNRITAVKVQGSAASDYGILSLNVTVRDKKLSYRLETGRQQRISL